MRLHHCTPAWVTEQDSVSKQKNKIKIPRSKKLPALVVLFAEENGTLSSHGLDTFPWNRLICGLYSESWRYILNLVFLFSFF